MSSSDKYGLLRRWSTPTVNDYGIHKKYTQSDQREWQIPCDHCGKYQVMNFEKNIELVDKSGIDILGKTVRDGSYRYVCQYCHKPLDRWYGGIWVPRYTTGNRSHGYSISQLDAVWITPDKMKEKELKAESLQSFYNYALGVPYQDKALSIQSEDIMNNRRNNLPKQLETRGEDYNWISIGIDWGQHYHWINVYGMKTNGIVDNIALHKVPRSVGVEHIEEDLRRVIMICNQYSPNIIVPDIGLKIAHLVSNNLD